MKFILLIAILTLSSVANANYNSAERSFKGRLDNDDLRSMIVNLTDSKYYFSAATNMRRYLIRRGRIDLRLERTFIEIVEAIGSKQFEILKSSYLSNSGSATAQYIYAKKSLKSNQFESALNAAKKVSATHRLYPLALKLLGDIYQIRGKYNEAINYYDDCLRFGKKASKMYAINRDYCVIAKARAAFSGGNYQEAESLFLDLEKKSVIWPEILIDEAWTSYHLKNFNRSLGKLVTYNSPVLNDYFSPEIATLNALSYLRLCLYDDAKRVGDEFTKRYYSATKNLYSYLRNRSRNDRHFYKLALEIDNKNTGSGLVYKIVKSITKEMGYREIKEGYIYLLREIDAIKGKNRSKLKYALLRDFKSSVEVQLTLMGSYVRNRFISQYRSLVSTMEGMSYIKLEILGRKKAQLYKEKPKYDGKRGDVQYLDRNEKQYFWDFNGEFWADELGDYVFALGSEC